MKEIKNLLNKNNILATTHYVPLHLSKYYLKKSSTISLSNAENFGNNILRLPLYNNLDTTGCHAICNIIGSYIKYNIIHITHSNINLSQIDKIIDLKAQFWEYSRDSQLEWIKNNIKDDDTHFLLFKEEKLIGYGLNMKKNYNIVDSIIIDKTYRGRGFGYKLVQSILKFIINNGFLLCEKHNIKFYEKFGWIEDNHIKIVGKDCKDNLCKMKYNLYNDEIIIKYN